jgi:hypothetical protein
MKYWSTADEAAKTVTTSFDTYCRALQIAYTCRNACGLYGPLDNAYVDHGHQFPQNGLQWTRHMCPSLPLDGSKSDVQNLESKCPVPNMTSSTLETRWSNSRAERGNHRARLEEGKKNLQVTLQGTRQKVAHSLVWLCRCSTRDVPIPLQCIRRCTLKWL